ncbi:aldo/keto reductase [Pseudomonas gingeri]|uniref:aldo/keto reductase n=1 Tax=Pseudomonas gingeri TaxID=117681 RepID=UPI0015A25314|nr:aldo/keto reductase [Pseudomonas gingeri]NVZ29474.1 aldo/keto reductase [Pseudomonas gingeri]NWE48724.1 aldo/keto reductase [Pseudomonas gingeri]
MSIEHISIAGIDKPVSRIALGTWSMGGWMWGGADDAVSIQTIRHALDSGINLIDTAPVYGKGHSELLIGKALAGVRHQAVIATKAGLQWDDGSVRRNATARRIRHEVEDSLRRLDTDYIDLYQIHWPDPLVAQEETAGELEKLRQEGKILAVGVSNYSPAQMDEFREYTALASVQPPYNLFERAIDSDILPYARQHEMVVLAYGSLCRGLLTGSMSPSTAFGSDDIRGADPKFRAPRFEQYLAAVAALDLFARERYDKSVLALALRWVLDQGPIIALWGARKPEQLKGFEEAFGWSLSADDLKQIDQILLNTIKDPVGPEFMAPGTR